MAAALPAVRVRFPLASISAVSQDGLCCPVSSSAQRNVMITLDSGHTAGEVFLMSTEYVESIIILIMILNNNSLDKA